MSDLSNCTFSSSSSAVPPSGEAAFGAFGGGGNVGEWEEEKRRREAALGCRRCGGINTLTCACAKREWEASRRQQPFRGEFRPQPFRVEFLHERRPDRRAELEQEWYERNKTSAELHAICNTCGGSSISNCACAKARWMENKKGF